MTKLLILGYARHGKDTVAEILQAHCGLRFCSSSLFCAERIIMPAFAARGIPYPSIEACFEDRGNHREFWFNQIADYNASDPTRLGREIFQEYDIYVGLRNFTEFRALWRAGVFDTSIWVLCPGVPTEPRESCSVEPDMADHLLRNDGTLDDLEQSTLALWRRIQENPDGT